MTEKRKNALVVLSNLHPFNFLYLITLTKSSNTLSNKNGGFGHPYFFPDLREKVLSLLFNMILVVGFSACCFPS